MQNNMVIIMMIIGRGRVSQFTIYETTEDY